jgi:hypothetical protein
VNLAESGPCGSSMAIRSASEIGSGRQARGVGVATGGADYRPNAGRHANADDAATVAAGAEATAEAVAAGGTVAAGVGVTLPAQPATRLTTSTVRATVRTDTPPASKPR